FRFPDLAPGTYTLTSQKPGDSPLTRTVVLTAEKDVLDADLVVEEGAEVVVVVRDASGAPLSGAYVNVYGPQSVSAQSDKQGEARVTLGAGEWTVSVFWSAEMDPKGRRFLPATQPVPADAKRIEIRMEEAASIGGRVVDPEGNGVGMLTV